MKERRVLLDRRIVLQRCLLASEFGYPVLPAVPESQEVLRYSLRGRYWRPVADRILAAIAQPAATRV